MQRKKYEEKIEIMLNECLGIRDTKIITISFIKDDWEFERETRQWEYDDVARDP